MKIANVRNIINLLKYINKLHKTYRLQPVNGFSDRSLWLTPIKPMVANIQAIDSNIKMATILTGRTTIVKNAV